MGGAKCEGEIIIQHFLSFEVHAKVSPPPQWRIQDFSEGEGGGFRSRPIQKVGGEGGVQSASGSIQKVGVLCLAHSK